MVSIEGSSHKKVFLRAPSRSFADKKVLFVALSGPSWTKGCSSRPFVEKVFPETGFLGLAPEVRASLQSVSIEMQPGDALCFTQITPHRALPNRSNQVRWSIDVRYEPTAQATEAGQKQGFIAHSPDDSGAVPTFEEWLRKWEAIPSGNY